VQAIATPYAHLIKEIMSQNAPSRKITAASFRASKSSSGKLVLLTAYSAQMAKIIAPHVDAILVGDSLGMVLYGFESTLPVTLEMMIAHTLAVKRGAPDNFIITDMPFGSYQMSPEQAFDNAAQLLKLSGADAVKLEGGVEMADTISYLTARGIPVMGHVGLMPQRINQLGSYKAQGRDEGSAAQIIMDARAVADAGAFSIVLEGVLKNVADEITRDLTIPTIGIGASQDCDGQVLVTDDMIGLFSEFTPKFVRKYADASGVLSKAVANYADDVRSGKFPSDREVFN